ncbi:MAG TPA: hypothetical protein VGR62_00465 [Candidatus Binatia bacterium]|jgi:hypothetical protein|nr:hypothetical protein [Candidatus Binatia bacterium]
MMENLLLATTVVDLLAVAGLAWLVMRSGRERELALADQRLALEKLRGELGTLLEDAEERGRSLERMLGAREQSLRALMIDLGRSEGPARPAAPERPLVRPFAAAETTPSDPAELRLRRELDLSLGRGRLA